MKSLFITERKVLKVILVIIVNIITFYYKRSVSKDTQKDNIYFVFAALILASFMVDEQTQFWLKKIPVNGNNKTFDSGNLITAPCQLIWIPYNFILDKRAWIVKWIFEISVRCTENEKNIALYGQRIFRKIEHWTDGRFRELSYCTNKYSYPIQAVLCQFNTGKMKTSRILVLISLLSTR